VIVYVLHMSMPQVKCHHNLRMCILVLSRVRILPNRLEGMRCVTIRHIQKMIKQVQIVFFSFDF